MYSRTLYTMFQCSAFMHFLSPSILGYMLWKNAEHCFYTGHRAADSGHSPTNSHRLPSLYRYCAYILISYPTSNTKIQRGYLDDLDAEGVIVRVATLVKRKAKRFLPVDRDTVEVLVC